MTKIRLPPTGFWSYSRDNDRFSNGFLSDLRSRVLGELQQFYGRREVKIFQDVHTIPPGEEWEREINAALEQSTFFIPIITPSFVQSKWCCRETAIFLRREADLNSYYPELRKRRRIFPLHLIDIRGAECFDPDVIGQLHKLQWVDFEPFRFGNLDSEPARRAVARFASSIRDLLRVEVEDTPVRATGSLSTSTTRGSESPTRRAAAWTSLLPGAKKPARTPAGKPDTDDDAVDAASRQEESSFIRPRAHRTRPAHPWYRDRVTLSWAGTAATLMLLFATIVIYSWYPSNELANANVSSIPPIEPPRDAPKSVSSSVPREEYSWLFGTWGIDGNCSNLLRIFRILEPGRIRIEFAGQSHERTILSADARTVATDRARYTRRGDMIVASDAGVDIEYELRRCEIRPGA